MFVFTYGDESWTFDDLRCRELEEIEDAAGVRHGELYPIHDMGHCMLILACFLRRTRDETEVAKILDTLTVADMRTIATWETGDDLPDAWEDGLPKAEAGPPTSG